MQDDWAQVGNTMSHQNIYIANTLMTCHVHKECHEFHSINLDLNVC
jgi:hypothetical protein